MTIELDLGINDTPELNITLDPNGSSRIDADIPESVMNMEIQTDGLLHLDISDDNYGDLGLELTSDGFGPEGTRDYEKLIHKPSIEQIELFGNKKLSDFGVGIVSNEAILGLFR